MKRFAQLTHVNCRLSQVLFGFNPLQAYVMVDRTLFYYSYLLLMFYSDPNWQCLIAALKAYKDGLPLAKQVKKKTGYHNWYCVFRINET